MTLFDDLAPAPKAPKRPNPCHNAPLTSVLTPSEHFGVDLLFTPSTVQLSAYAAAKRHKVPTKADYDAETHPDEQVSRETFDDAAVATLQRRYPKDPLYPRLAGFRILQKALTSYIESLRPGAELMWGDGRIHDAFRHTPKTMRLAMKLLQVLPRPNGAPDGTPEAIYNEIRQCFVPLPGHTFVARDMSNVEPLLVAYCAKDAHFLRACMTSSHSWFAANVIGKPPDFTWSDEDIAAYYESLSKQTFTLRGDTFTWKQIRNACKGAGMASLYAGGPGEIARHNPDVFPDVATARYYQDAFFGLCPRVRQWHWETAETAERQGYLLTPIGLRLHYDDLFSYRKVPSTGQWVKTLNRVAKEAIAAVPQHIGAMYLTTATVTFDEERPDLADYLRLLIHDEVFGEVPNGAAEEFTAVLGEVMERPHPLMPLWDEAQALTGLSHLRVRTEVKQSGESWGRME